MKLRKYIRRFNKMNGNMVTRETLEKFLAQVPDVPELSDLRSKLQSAISRIPDGHPPILIKFRPLPYPEEKHVVKKKSTVGRKPLDKAPEEKSPSMATSKRYRQIELDEPYTRDFPRLYSDTQMMYYGLPGSGKTVDLLIFAKYLAGKGFPVLYVAAEEYGRSTFDEKIEEFQINHPNLELVKNLKDASRAIDQYDVIFFDSVNKMKWSVDDWTDFADRHPNMIKIAIVQTTKDGDFKGGQEWAHEMDIVVEIRNRKRIVRKNRLDPDFAQKRDALLLEDKIREKTLEMKVKESVKARVTPEPYRELATYMPDTII